MTKLWWSVWVVAGEQRAEQPLVEVGVEDGDSDAVGGDGVAMCAGEAFDQAVEAEPAQPLARLVETTQPPTSFALGVCVSQTTDRETTQPAKVIAGIDRELRQLLAAPTVHDVRQRLFRFYDAVCETAVLVRAQHRHTSPTP